MDEIIAQIRVEPDLVANAESALKAVKERLPNLVPGADAP
jgi:hypothetical protein